MKKRLLAMLMACCMAASMASAVFAADDGPIVTEPAAVVEQVDPPAEPEPQPAQEEPPAEEQPAEQPAEQPTPEPPAPEQEATPEPTAEPAPEPTAEPTPEVTAEPTAAPTPEATPEAIEDPAAEATPEPTAEPTATVEPSATPAVTATPAPTAAPVAVALPATPETAAAEPVTLEVEPQAEPVEQALRVTRVTLQSSVETDGCYTAVVNGSAALQQGVTYTWERSLDKRNWTEVEPKICSGQGGWNVDPDAPNKLNAALDTCAVSPGNTGRFYYRVTVTGSNTVTSASAQVPYYIQLQNGGFETPKVKDQSVVFHWKATENNNNPSHFIQWNANEGQIIWKTTGEERRWDQKNWPGAVPQPYIELVDGVKGRVYIHKDDQNQPYECINDPANTYFTPGANSGEQFAELNCEVYGALYQDVLTVPGATLYWSLAHRGRNGPDSMVLLIAPTEVATDIETKLKNKASGNIADALNETVTMKGELHTISDFIVKENGNTTGIITDDNTAWKTHSGTYSVPDGKYVSRFFFLAISTKGNNICEGNYLDDVWFSTTPAPAVADHANLTVRKELIGDLTAEQQRAIRAALTFTVTRSDGTNVATIRGADMTVDADNPAVSSIVVQNLPLTSDDGSIHYTYTVTEALGTTPAGLLWLGSAVSANGDTWQEVTGGDIKVENLTLNTAQTVTAGFRNTYAQLTGSLKITKAVPEDASAALRAEANAVTNTFTLGTLPIGSYTLTYADGSTENVPLDAGGSLTIQLQGLQTVTVGNLPIGDYTVTETDHPDLANYYCTTTATTAAVHVSANEDAEAVITNTYAPYRSITITKRVTGGMADTRRGFAFTAKVDGNPITSSTLHVTYSGGAEPTETGFTIPHKGSVTIGHLRPGQTFTVEEESTEYDAEIQIGNDTILDTSYSGTVGEENTALTFVNKKDGAPPTGLAQDAAPALLMLVAALTCTVLRRRKGARP